MEFFIKLQHLFFFNNNNRVKQINQCSFDYNVQDRAWKTNLFANTEADPHVSSAKKIYEVFYILSALRSRNFSFFLVI